MNHIADKLADNKFLKKTCEYTKQLKQLAIQINMLETENMNLILYRH